LAPSGQVLAVIGHFADIAAFASRMGFGIAVAPGPKGTAAVEHDFGKEQVTQEVQKEGEFADEILEVPVYKEKKAAEEKAVKEKTAEAEAEASDVKAAKEEFTEAAEEEAVKVKERATKAKASDEKAAKEKTAEAEAKASADKVASEMFTDTEAAKEMAAMKAKERAKYTKAKASDEKAPNEKTADAEAKASADKVANEKITDTEAAEEVAASVLEEITAGKAALEGQQKQAKVLAGQVQGEGGATSGSSCSETLGSCDAEGVDSASDGEDVTETFSRAGLAKMELEIQQATTKGAKRIAKEAFRVYKIELEDAEFDEMVRVSRADELHRVYED